MTWIGGIQMDSGHDQEFRAAALALLCLLDAALAWRPADPMGWMGQAEDAESAVLAREREMCSFPYFAGRLRRSLKKASAGGQGAGPLSWEPLRSRLWCKKRKFFDQPAIFNRRSIALDLPTVANPSCVLSNLSCELCQNY